MIKTIDEIMYIVDGNNPFREHLLIGRGGLGYKPYLPISGGTLSIKVNDKEYKGKDEIIDYFEDKFEDHFDDPEYIKKKFEKIKELNPNEEDYNLNDIKYIKEWNKDVDDFKEIVDMTKEKYKESKALKKKVDDFKLTHSPITEKIDELGKKLSDFNKDYDINNEPERQKNLKKNIFEAIRNNAIDNKLDKMKKDIQSPQYQQVIDKLIDITTNAGSGYGTALENLFENPSTPEEKKIVRDIMSQVAYNYKKSDKITDNNKTFNNPFFVIDLALEDKQALTKMLLELKNQISSQAKVKKWTGVNTLKDINDYELSYNNSKRDFDDKLKEAIKNNDKTKEETLRKILRNFRYYYDTQLNKSGTRLTDNKISGAEGSTVPKYDKDRNLIRIDEYKFDKIDTKGTPKKYNKLSAKSLFLQDNALLKYDISGDSNNKLVKQIYVMDNDKNKPRINRFNNLPLKRTILYPSNDFYMESSYPRELKNISGKNQIVRVIPPHKTKLIKL